MRSVAPRRCLRISASAEQLNPAPVGETGAHARQFRRGFPVRDQGIPDVSGYSEHGRHFQKRLGRKGRALLGQGERGAHIRESRQGAGAEILNDNRRFLGLLLGSTDLFEIGLGFQRKTDLASHFGHCQIGQLFPDLGKLQHAQRAFLHLCLYHSSSLHRFIPVSAVPARHRHGRCIRFIGQFHEYRTSERFCFEYIVDRG